MSALWLPPIDTSLVQEEQEFATSSSRKLWILFGFLFIFATTLVSLAVWRVTSPPTLSIADKFSHEDIENGITTQTSPQLLGTTPPLFDANEVRALASLQNWENPFSSSPCFVRGLNTCQYSFFGGVGLSHDLALYSLNLPKRQEKQDLFFLFGRMLVARGAMYETQQPNLATGELQPYYLFLERVSAAGQGYAINPAFLFVMYEQIFLSASQSGLSADQTFELLPPERLAQNFSLALNTPSTMRSTPFGEAILAKDWTLEAKALVFTLAQALNTEVLNQALSEPGVFEKKYYEIFAPAEMKGEISFTFTPTALTAEHVFSLSSPAYDYPLCQKQKAQLCLQNAGLASCAPFPLFDQYCSSLLNLPTSIEKNNESQKESL